MKAAYVHLTVSVLVYLAIGLGFSQAVAQPSPFLLPEGLAGAVDFWKEIFTRYDSASVVMFDPLDPGKVYSVLRVAETEQGRLRIARERSRIAADYDLVDDETRIRSQRGAKNQFSEGLKMSGRYIAEMENIFRSEGLPIELALLPLVESSFNVRARSSAGAAGMWQFMPETGKKFMRIDAAVDERRDPLASTRAAARLLKQNYQILGSWPLAITAYNHGTEGILRAISTVGSHDLGEIIRRYDGVKFGFASKNFYVEFLAVVEIAANRESYFPFLRLQRPVKLIEVPLKRAAALHAVLRPVAIGRSDFFAWNPALEPSTTVLPVGYRVRLPAEKVDRFLTVHGHIIDRAAAKRVTLAIAGRGKSRPIKRPKNILSANISKRSPVIGKAKISRMAMAQNAKG